MRNVAPGQPAGEAAWRETAHMDEEEAAAPPKGGKDAGGDTAADADALPMWMDGNTLLNMEHNTPKLLIAGEHGTDDGAILREQSKLVVGGASKAGKTWCLLDLALAVAAGGKWLGRFQCVEGAVLYINLELQPWTAGARVRAIAEARRYTKSLGLDEAVSKNLQFWNLRGVCYDIDAMLAVARTRIKAGTVPAIKLIIVDPIYKAYASRDENSATDMANLMLQLEQFAKECGAAVAFGAHFSKGNQAGKDAMDRISGSGVVARDPDAIITLTSHEDDDCYVMDCTLREFAPVPPVVLQWDFPVMNPRPDLDPAKLKQPGKKTDTFQRKADAILAVLKAAGGGPMVASELIVRATKEAKDNTTTGAWKQAINRHLHVLAEMGIERTTNATKEATYKLKNEPL